MQENKKITPVVIEENVMPIVGYWGPARFYSMMRNRVFDFIQDDIYEKIKDLGINLINRIGNDYANPEERQAVLDSLAYAEKYGLYMFVSDHRMQGELSDEDVEYYLSKYNQFKSFRGIAVRDEPRTEYYAAQLGPEFMDKYMSVSKKLNQHTDIMGYINLFAYGSGNGSTEDYKRYVEECIVSCGVKVVSYDYYPFFPGHDTKEFRQKYFAKMELVKEKAAEYHVPFWGFVQAGANWNDEWIEMEPTDNCMPTRGEMLWNVNTYLAYGAKGIQYFPLIQPYHFAFEVDGRYDYGRNGLIGADGQPTKWYDYAKDANRQIALVDEVLLNSENTDILAVGTAACTDTTYTMKQYGDLMDIQVSNPEEGTVVGCFDYQGKQVFYVVNHDMAQQQTIDLCFKRDVVCQVISQQCNQKETKVTWNGNSYSLELEAGGAALVIIE